MPAPIPRSAVLAALLVCAANCPGPPWALRQSPSSIVLRWYPNETPFAKAEGTAALYCGNHGRTAQLASDQRDGSAEIARYRCRCAMMACHPSEETRR
jgi:hypothetical protein